MAGRKTQKKASSKTSKKKRKTATRKKKTPRKRTAEAEPPSAPEPAPAREAEEAIAAPEPAPAREVEEAIAAPEPEPSLAEPAAAEPPAAETDRTLVALQEFFFSSVEAAEGSGGLYSAAGSAEHDSAHEYLSFDLANESYAVPVTALREIVRPLPITPVPRTPDYVQGVVTLRGTVLPVFDLRLRLRLPRPEPTAASRILVVETADGAAGILVDRVEGVVRGGEEGLEAPPTSLGSGADYLDGLLRIEGKLHIVLDLNAALIVHLGGRRADGRMS